MQDVITEVGTATLLGAIPVIVAGWPSETRFSYVLKSSWYLRPDEAQFAVPTLA